MRRFLIILILLGFTNASPPPAAGQQSEANRLLVEAGQLIAAAEAEQDAAARAGAYDGALARLEQIVARHPESYLAVMLVTGQQIGTLSLPLLRRSAELARLQAEIATRDVIASAAPDPAAGAEASALAAENERLQAALSEEQSHVTILLMEQAHLRNQFASRERALEADLAQLKELEATAARVAGLETRNAALTTSLSVERDRFAQLERKVQAIEAAAGTAAAPEPQQRVAEAAPAASDSPTATQQAALPEAALPPSPVSAEEIAAALKEALRLGTERVVERVGRVDGFNADPAIRIPLPENLAPVGDALRAMGLGAIGDDLELRLNRAAETAAPRAQEIFLQAVAEMEIADIQGVFQGPEDSATRYFRDAMSAPLAQAMRPVIDQSLAEAGAVQAYDQMIGKYKSIPLVPDVKADLTEHVLVRAMEGLFLYLAKEEAAIRNDAVKRTTELLQRVFGDHT